MGSGSVPPATPPAAPDLVPSLDYVKAVGAGQFAAVIKLLDVELQSEKHDATRRTALLINRGISNAQLQLYRKALKDLDAALALTPSSVKANYHKGVVLVALKRPEEACKVWESALAHASLETDVALVAALQSARTSPHSVLRGTDLCAYLWWHATRPWAVAVLACLVLACAGVLLQHTLQVAPGVAAAGAAWYAPGGGAGRAALIASGGGSVPGAADTSHSGANATPSAGAPSNESAHLTLHGVVNKPAGTGSPDRAPGARLALSSPRDADTQQPSPPATSSTMIVSQSVQGTTSEDGGECVDVDCAAQQRATRALQSGFLGGTGSTATHRRTKGREEGSPSPSTRAAGSGAAAGGAGVGGVAGGSASTAAAAAAAAQMHALQAATAIQVAVSQINAGHIAEAEALLDSVLAGNPRELGARVARGTARALRRDLEGAVEDFSVAIELEPRYADSWKRRGQARAALGHLQPALSDLQKAIDLLPLFGKDAATNASIAECHVERGLVLQKARDYRRAGRELQQAVRLDPSNAQAWNLFGLACTSQGDLEEGVAAYQRAVKLRPDMKEAWFNMAQVRKEAGDAEGAEAAFARVHALEPAGGVNIGALRVMAQMKQQSGEHAAAIGLLDKALSVAKDEVVLDLLYTRAICHHALGHLRQAAADYQACLSWTARALPATSAAPPVLSDEQRTLQYLSWYQREMALYLYTVLDKRADSFCPDVELPPLFKEAWCKKAPITPDLIADYIPQPALPPASSAPAPPPPADPQTVAVLRAVADQLGALLQNRHQGFMRNVRQQRAAGLAALELAQAVRAMVSAKRAGQRVWVASAGSSVAHASTTGRHEFGWRDAMDVVVKWRQLAEPNDQVVWVDLLTRREFEQGFGSHTPIYSGQTKCVRYYMNFQRALELQKQVLLQEGHAIDAANRPVPCGSPAQQEAIRAARTAADMYEVLQTDSWVVVPIASASRPEHIMEGTRLTLVKVPSQLDAYEFSIRTPVTPPRWSDFDTELTAAWDSLVTALATDAPPLAVARATLTFTYYWYNFMPLARGTAATGYTALLSLFWAADMPVTVRIPKSYQVDWEAILAQTPEQFITSVSPWLLPAAARTPDVPAASTPPEVGLPQGLPDVSSLPLVKDALATLRERIEALNPDSVARI